MIIEYTIHQYHKHAGDHHVSLAGNEAVSMGRAMREQGVFAIGHHADLGITVTRIEYDEEPEAPEDWNDGEPIEYIG